MKALQFSATGDLAALSLVDVETPVPAAGEVLVRIKAAGLNPSDVKNVLGRFPYTTLPRIPGRDFAGVVVEGPQALLGRDVWGTGRDLGFFADGSHAQYLRVSAKGVAHKPTHLSFAQAASLGVPYTTAWDALERSGVGKGTRLLVIGANGAVGSAALALAKIRGAQVLAAVRKADQAEALQAQGMQAIVLGEPQGLGAQVNAVYQGGADVIFDTTGFWLPAAVAGLAPFGRIAIIAAPVDGHVQLPALALYRKGGSVVGINSLLYNCEQCAVMLEQFGRFFDEGSLPLPTGLREVALVDGVRSYQEVNGGSVDKIIFLP
ncbi:MULTISPECIES: quinone oxidoreductase family protein [Pseudomonas]|jgi:NADPH:quinone reductase|uniref:Zinc-binding alcohol dehydrogenase family protein n=2 Tax=Pseudomonas TaxID=286 RepID=A0A4Y9T7U3_PSEFL|nr:MULTISPECIES: zinc-binding alcohol dehydrogenase family protein [Pseudomonas]CRM89968.1 2-deoxy-scyllo-inosamine dehydrogenase [Pseudomonas sp. 22 E 5]MCX9152946.1 zinc-binding alcohol dehydrogenase family protein [Pseudomonas sp. TB1-B1]QXH69748.1 zinc-binding alcohol dehydrogenase family protein [Pseudomonas asgharzadehiana]TFW40443.1 zinc-binding alcohol dehydrogenase family protein [Pseudomonas fluorescens]CRM18174.1 2-deoxy-scyllo-inosamine dehydrogenase [Pseudomonas sp. 31 E 6]